MNVFQFRSVSLRRAAVFASLALPAMASASTLLSSNFSDGTTTGYTTGGAANGIALSVVDDGNNLATGGGNALSANVTASTSYALVNFGNTTLADGDSITASFDMRISSAATPNNGDRIFRFGFYNTSSSVGFTGRMDTGNDTTNTSTADVFRSSSIFNTATANGSQTLVASTTNTDAALNDNLLRHVTLTITHSGVNASGSLTIQKGTNTPVTITGALNNPPPNSDYFTLGEFIIGINGTPGGPGISGAPAETFNLDNLTIATTPEPGSLALLGMGGVALLKRRRSV